MMGRRTFFVTLGIAAIAMLALVILAAPPAWMLLLGC